MNIPLAVKKQVEAAEALRVQAYSPKEPETQNTDEQSGPEVVDQPVLVAPVEQRPVTTTDDENNPTYAQRWRSLQGVYNTTKSKLDDAMSRIGNMESLISSMQQGQQAPKTKQSLVTDTDVNEYGSDMVEFARRVAREENSELQTTIGDLQAEIKQLRGMTPVLEQVVTRSNQNAEQQFFSNLANRRPDWEQINANASFHKWLLSADPMTGITPQTYLIDAQQNRDVSRVVNIFAAWENQAGVKPVPLPAVARNSQLEKQIAPGKASAASAPPSQQAEKTYSRADITNFYRDRLNGKYKGREAEASATERDIFKAQGEGRVV